MGRCTRNARSAVIVSGCILALCGTACPGGGSSDFDASDADAEADADSSLEVIEDPIEESVEEVAEVVEEVLDIVEEEEPPAPEPDPEGAALDRLADESETPVEARYDEDTPGFVSVSVPIPPSAPPDPVFVAFRFLGAYESIYGLALDDLYVTRLRTAGDETGAAHVFFGQRRNGILVYGAELAVHMASDRILFTNGHYLRDVPPLPEPEVDMRTAVAVALTLLPSYEGRLVGRPSLSIFNLGLVRGESPANFETVLAWRINVAGLDQNFNGNSWLAFVDAQDGELLMALEDQDQHDAAPEFQVLSAFGTYSSDCWDDPGSEATFWFDQDGAGPDYAAEADTNLDGQHAFDYAQVVDEFYVEQHHRHSWRGDESPFEILVHAAEPARASYDSRCNNLRFGTRWVTLDHVAHEWAHAIDTAEADLIGAFQSGALAESFADISAIRVDAEDYTIGEDLPGELSSLARSLYHEATIADYAPADGAPTRVNDWGGIHTHRRIPNHVASLIFEGGEEAGLQIQGLGRAKAGRLYYAVWVDGLTTNATFQDARDLMVGHARYFAHPPADGDALHGFTDQDVCDVVNAWAAVGIGAADGDCDGEPDVTGGPDADGDGVPDAADNCPDILNFSQADLNEDGIGDACDDDVDGDDILNDADPCMRVAGDDLETCTDDDGDSWVNADDNCPDVANRAQENADGDDLGDACDDDDDEDGALDGDDGCPSDADESQADGDADGVGDACDNCPELANPNQSNCDGDDLGAACDPNEALSLEDGSCAPPWSEETTVTVLPRRLLEIAGCPDCPPFLPADFEISVAATVGGDGLPLSIVDDQGRLMAQGQAGSSQTLSFRPRASFWFGTALGQGFQVTRYFIFTPGLADGPAYDVTLTVDHP